MFLLLETYFFEQTIRQREQQLERKLAQRRLIQQAMDQAKQPVRWLSLHSLARKLRAHFYKPILLGNRSKRNKPNAVIP